MTGPATGRLDSWQTHEYRMKVSVDGDMDTPLALAAWTVAWRRFPPSWSA
jgi:hypothetical protein